MKVFDADYQKIINELQKNGENKQIIYAMISNLQTRISFLQTVLKRIEENENLKQNNAQSSNSDTCNLVLPPFGNNALFNCSGEIASAVRKARESRSAYLARA